ncbi:hypothetical protein N0V90_011471 [Kalmusia sp. IMI 367209]|nr:hypothetical protein N0V90_011471 [Kalmusia sp. IMI 367209]
MPLVTKLCGLLAKVEKSHYMQFGLAKEYKPLHKAEERRKGAEEQSTAGPELHVPQEHTSSIAMGSSTAIVRRVSSGIDEATQDRLALLLLSLHSMVLMAFDELKSLGEDLLSPLKHDPACKPHADSLYAVCGKYHKLAVNLPEEDHRSCQLEQSSDGRKFGSRKLRSKLHSIFTSRRFNSGDRASQRRSKLLMQSKFTDTDAATFIQCQQAFISNFKALLNGMPEISSLTDIDIFRENPLFVPARLVKNYRIRDHVRTIGLRDLLGRSVILLELDAGVQNVAFDPKEDLKDILGRSIIHAACAYGNETIVDMLRARYSVNVSGALGGLSPLEIAASRGHLGIFTKLFQYYELPYLQPYLIAWVPLYEIQRNSFKWAASCGQEKIVDFYLCYYNFGWDHDIFTSSRTDDVQLSQNEATAAFQLAIRYNHAPVVRVMKNLLVEPILLRDHMSRTPFWYTAHYKRIDIMRMLGEDSPIHLPDKEGRSPLSEAARGGFFDGIKYILNQQHVKLPSGHIWYKDKMGKTAEQHAIENGFFRCGKYLRQFTSQ